MNMRRSASDRYALPNATPDVTEVPECSGTPPVEIFDGDSESLRPCRRR